MSASDAFAISCMCRQRPAMPFTSPRACPSGLPIWRVMSFATSSIFASNAVSARSQRATRSSTDMRRSARAPSRARSSVRSIAG